MNLHELHTAHPLGDADFAAIRARVKAEIARPSRMAMLLRFAFAASLFAVFVPYVRERAPEVPVQVAERRPATPIAAPASPPDGRAASSPSRTRENGGGHAAAPAAETAALQATRIEIVTADPTIRIIWLTPPKENNS